MIAVYADSNLEDVRVVHPASMEFAFGSDENDFEARIPYGSPRMDALGYLYVDGTECGGLVTDIENDRDGRQVVYTGMTWHGLLAAKVLQPDSGADYYTVSGEVNACISAVLRRIGLDGIMSAEEGSTGTVVKSHQFDRYCSAYDGLCKMLGSVGLVLTISCLGGRVTIGSAAAASHGGEATTKRHGLPVNHLICLGEGELKDRTVVHLYADSEGSVSETQTLSGVLERAEVYDYSSADADKLREDGTKRLEEYQVLTSADMADASGGGYRIGDTLTDYDQVTDVTASAKITKKIVSFDSDMHMSTSYSCEE